MSGITDYEIIQAPDATSLRTQIAAAILAGWQPVIGPAIVFGDRLLKEMTKGDVILVGDTGATGAAGAAGHNVTFGSTVPDDGDGANGDVYIRTTIPSIYKKAAGTWGAATPINIT